MRPLKLRIYADATDHFIYQGYLYVILSRGAVVRASMNEVYSNLIGRYSDYEGVLQLAFRRNNFWNSDAARCFLSIREVNNALQRVWRKVADSMVFEINLDDLHTETIFGELSDEVLDIDLYYNYLLLAGLKGFYSIRLQNYFNPKERRNLPNFKRFDGKTYKIASAYCNSILSLGKEGWVANNLLNEKMVNDRKVRDDMMSFASDWTAAGGLMNYSSPKEFQFIGNRLQKSKVSPEKYEINAFDVTYKNFESLFSDEEKFAAKIEMGFNSRDRQFYLLSDGRLYVSPVRVSNTVISRLNPTRNSGVKLDYNKLGRPLSGLSVADQQVIECEDNLVLIDGGKQYILEDESIVSMHSYPRSTHFRDIVSVTTEESINIHALSVFRYSNELLFPPQKQYR